jgi:hypothetical protein
MGNLSALSGSNEGNAEGLVARQQAFRDIGKGALSNSPAPASATQKASPAPKPKPNPATQYGSRPGEKRIDTSEMTKPLGSFKKGGKVKKTGVYKLHKGERVLNAKQTAKTKAKGGLAAILGGRA